MSDLNEQENSTNNPSEFEVKRDERAREIQHSKGKLTATERIN